MSIYRLESALKLSAIKNNLFSKIKIRKMRGHTLTKATDSMYDSHFYFESFDKGN